MIVSELIVFPPRQRLWTLPDFRLPPLLRIEFSPFAAVVAGWGALKRVAVAECTRQGGSRHVGHGRTTRYIQASPW